jgi:aminoglycoside phosphotransferase (APT) family kinase protein
MVETKPVREGEEIDVYRLRVFLSSEFDLPDINIEIEQFPSGSSNLTYLIRTGDAEFVLRRPPFGNTVKTAHDMGREFNILSKLSKVFAPAPKPLLFCEDKTVIGSEFYLMQRRQGLIIRGHSPSLLVSSEELQQEVCESFVRNLAGLHSLDPVDAGLSELGRPQGYVQRQVEGWSKRYFAAKTHELQEIEQAIEWLNKNIPAESGACIIHNDYKFDNIMLDPSDLTRVTAVLDWEMATVGDPLMDLGTTLGYWMSADAGDEMLNMPFNPRVMMENISRTQLVEMYAAASGHDVSNILYYYVFGTLKIAVIAQQIYARYLKGFTADERFAHFDRFVHILGTIGWSAIQKRSI